MRWARGKGLGSWREGVWLACLRRAGSGCLRREGRAGEVPVTYMSKHLEQGLLPQPGLGGIGSSCHRRLGLSSAKILGKRWIQDGAATRGKPIRNARGGNTSGHNVPETSLS